MLKRITREQRSSRAGEHQAVVCVSGALWRKAVLGSLAGVSLCILCVYAMCFLTGCRENGSAVILSGTEDGSVEIPESIGEEEPSSAEGETASSDTSDLECLESTAAWIYVHVCGQVCEPGVYGLAEGSRVWDAVKAAGGLTEDAEATAVNLAMTVADGSKVIIPSKQEAKAGGFDWYETGSASGDGTASQGMGSGTNAVDAAEGLVDINQADLHGLMTIPGIGQTRAEAIIAHRQRQGPFGSIEEIMNVTGIKEGLFAKIRDYITVGG